MKAILLAAGFGTRLRPITNNIPKCLVKVNDKPVLLHWIEMLFDSGVDSILINTHYLSDKVVDFIDSLGYKDKILISYEKELHGTAGTITANTNFLDDEPFLLIHADNFTVCDLKEFIQAHSKREKNTKITMMLYKTDRPKESGIVKLNEQNVVTQFYEKVESPPGDLANAAVYIIEPDVSDFILDKKLTDFSTEVIPFYLNKINTWLNTGYHIDIGTPEALKKANNDAVTLL